MKEVLATRWSTGHAREIRNELAHPPGPVTIMVPEPGQAPAATLEEFLSRRLEVRTMTPEEFRHLRGLEQCPKCLVYDVAESFSPAGRTRAHHCRFVSSSSRRPSDTYQSGVDAWYGTRPKTRSGAADDAPDPTEA